jgi:hypothetical protein
MAMLSDPSKAGLPTPGNACRRPRAGSLQIESLCLSRKVAAEA